MNEDEFKAKYLDAIRLPDCDGSTVRAYATVDYMWLFDKRDGHLAWKFERSTRTVLYACEHMKEGARRLLGIGGTLC